MDLGGHKKIGDITMDTKDAKNVDEYSHVVRNAVQSIRGIFRRFDQYYIIHNLVSAELQKVDDASKKISEMLDHESE
jgi:hypothetical protein